eukprot:7163490-Prymnesium_polylepis.1
MDRSGPGRTALAPERSRDAPRVVEEASGQHAAVALCGEPWAAHHVVGQQVGERHPCHCEGWGVGAGQEYVVGAAGLVNGTRATARVGISILSALWASSGQGGQSAGIAAPSHGGGLGQRPCRIAAGY